MFIAFLLLFVILILLIVFITGIYLRDMRIEQAKREKHYAEIQKVIDKQKEDLQKFRIEVMKERNAKQISD